MTDFNDLMRMFARNNGAFVISRLVMDHAGDMPSLRTAVLVAIERMLAETADAQESLRAARANAELNDEAWIKAEDL